MRRPSLCDSLVTETCMHNPNDGKDEVEDDVHDSGGVFKIHPKHTPLESLQKWRQATLALNAARRFRYTLDLAPEHLLKRGEKMVRTNICALRAVHRFKEAAARITIEDPPPDGFELGPRSLQLLVQEQQFSVLQKIGGVEGVAKLIHADLYYGIIDDPKDIQSRKKAFGENSYPRKSPKKILDFIWEACQDTTLIILEICAVISLITGMTSPKEGVKKGWYDGASIGFAVVLIILVTAFSDYKQSLEFRNLNEEKRNIQIQVTRGGRRQKVSIFSLVVGDIIPLAIGDQIPADGIIVSGYSILVDESSMTGESEPTHKDIKHPFLLSGCKVVDGHGIMLVTGVGMHTEWGNIMASFSEDTGKETPLQVRLNGTATFIGKVGLAVATIVFIVLFVRYFSIGYKYGTPAGEVISRLANIFSIAVVIVVIAVPEGLPLAVTLTLAYSMRKMMNDKSLVRHLSACETMGSATIICSDKTGTLTLNQMTVLKAWVSGKMWEGGVSRALCYNSLNLLLEGIVQNSTGSVYSSKEGAYPEVSGSPTEKAILSWGLEIGMKFEDVKRKASIFKVEAFNSERKRAGVAIMLENGDIHVHWKGAAEIILNLCDKQLNTDGSISQIDGEEGKKLLSVINGMASESLRCIALAFDVVKKEDVPLEEEQLASWKLPDGRLTFLAILGIKDPCRPGVLEAIRTCQAAGVKVLMVTGDNLLTAKAIARDCGILTDGLAIEGIEFRNYNSQEIMDCLPNLQVLARSLPTDKLLLVKKLKEFDEVVAVTGDGANDAAALCEADVGLSMGISGTEVAKESSDIIILDDNFGSVVKVVRWGRSVYFNIQKFIQFQLTINVAALGLNFVAALSEGDVPLNTVQMLWVNLIMDTLGALALATEHPTDTLMQRKPVGWSDPLVTNKMWRDLLGQAGYQLAVLLALYYKGEKIFKLSGFQEKKLKERNTIIFNTFVLCQVFNEINARKPDTFNIFEGIFTNHLFIGVMTITIIFQVFIVEFLNNFAQTTKLSWQQWCSCIVIGFFSLPLAFLLKCIPVPKRLVIRTHKLKYKYKRSNQVDQTIKSASEAPTGPTLTGVQGVPLSHQQHQSPLRSSEISETVSEINVC